MWSLRILEGLVPGPHVVTRIHRYSSPLYKMVSYSQPSTSTGANCIYRKVHIVISVWLPFHILWTRLCNQQPDEGLVHYSTPDIRRDLFCSLSPQGGHCPDLPLLVLVQPVFLLLFLSEVCKKMALWALASTHTAFAWRLFSYNLDLWLELLKLFCVCSLTTSWQNQCFLSSSTSSQAQLSYCRCCSESSLFTCLLITRSSLRVSQCLAQIMGQTELSYFKYPHKTLQEFPSNKTEASKE